MRYAVIAEGAADLILVPAILKEGLGLECLGFQVVPGLSSGTSDEIAILDNESARTAYLVDGDSAGTRMKTKVRAAGVDEKMIISLPAIESAETVIEDYVDSAAYLAAVAEELRRSGCKAEISICDLQRPNRPKRLEEWCKLHNNGRVPSKRAVAYHIVESRFARPIVDSTLIPHTTKLYDSIKNALGLKP
jgi:predicted ATP-dependent endonuclease of OLD family